MGRCSQLTTMRAVVLVVGLMGALPCVAEVPVCTAPSTQDQVAVAAGDSLTVIVWRDSRNSLTSSYDLYGQAFDYRLNPLWTPTRDSALLICGAGEVQDDPAVAVGPDGLAWIAWRDARACGGPTRVFSQTVNKAGAIACTADGVVRIDDCRSPGSNHPKVLSTAAGVGLITLNHMVPIGGGFTQSHLITQQVSAASCSPLASGSSWDSPWTGAPDLDAGVISDGEGGQISAFEDDRCGTPYLFAQRLNAAFAPVWNDGVPICSGVKPPPVRVCTDNAQAQRGFALASDGSGGTILVYEQGAVGARSIWAQRIDGSGVRQWGTCGKLVAAGGGNLTNPRIVRSTLGRTFVIWEADYAAGNSDIFAQRLNFLGDTLASRIAVCTAPYAQSLPQSCAAPNGGCFVVWQDGRDIAIGDDAHVYAQRLDAAGNLLCDANGWPVAALPGTRQYNPRIVAVKIGGSTRRAGGDALVVWSDNRNGYANIYAQALKDSCPAVVLAVDSGEPEGATLRLNAAPNPVAFSTRIMFSVAEASSATLCIYDLAGRLVRVLLENAPMAAGQHHATWDATDRSGARVRAGVYFCRLRAGDVTRERTIIVR